MAAQTAHQWLYRQVYPFDNYDVVMVEEMGAWRGKAEKVYAQLRHDIEGGTLAPGQTLSEVELVNYTGASRTPVREAIRRLAADGLVDLEPRRAPTVSRISLRSARALFDFRRLIEPEAVRAVAQRAETDPALRDELLGLLDDFAAMQGAAHDDAFAAQFRNATSTFDRIVARHTPNDYLARAIADLRPHSARLRYIAHGDKSHLEESVDEHIRMCTAIVDANPDAAAEAMVTHLHHVDQAIFRQLLNTGTSDVLVS